MNLQELFSIIKTNGLHPIRIQSNSPRDGDVDLVMVGELEDFIDSTKALNENVVFVNLAVFEEADFVYEAEAGDEPFDEDDLEDELDDSPDEIDLSTVLPEMQVYKKYLNTECGFELTIFFKSHALKYYCAEKWWLEFQELRERAIEKIEGQESLRREELEEARAKLEEEDRRRQQVLVSQLRDLIKDGDFVRLSARKDSTQRAMQAYALEAIPELEELSTELLRAEIQQLSDRIKAKKVLNK